jgi:YgiT-type zinc finger domain-containing protein
MKCPICRQGETAPGRVTVTLERGETVVVIRDVPAEVCGSCGEYCLGAAVAEKVLASADDAVKRGAAVEIVKFAA